MKATGCSLTASVNNARLDNRARPDGLHRFGKALEPVTDQHQHVVQAAVLQLGEHMQPVLALACLSPPRLSRRRRLLPEDCSTGLAPQSAAKDASLPSRSGLSPAAINRAA